MIKVKERIRHNGVSYEANSEIKNISIKEAERLVNLGVAFFTQKAPSEDSDVNFGLQLEDKDVDFRLQLDESFNATELKEAAQEVGLEFPGNISKTNLIELIISSEKAEEVLSVEFEEYEEDEE